MRKLFMFIILTAACIVMTTAVTWSDVPQNMNVQGRLTDNTGTPVASGFKLFTFKIYNDEFGGGEIWPAGPGETQTIYTDDNGLWNAKVGAILGLTESVFDSDTIRWLEITVDDGVLPPESLPRMKLNTNPFTYMSASSQWAEDAALFAGHPYSDFAQAVHGHAPPDISPQGTGSGLDADLLDNRHASYFLDASNITTGTLAMPRYSAYADLDNEGYLNNNSSSDLMTRIQSDGRYVNIIGDVMTGALQAPAFWAGHPGLSGEFDLYRNGSAGPVIEGRPFGSQGASWILYDETGSLTHIMEADGNGTGGYFRVGGTSSASQNFTVDGNNGTGNPTVIIRGSGSTTTFATDQTGNNSVVLPAEAIFDSEIMDEPGIASARSTSLIALTAGGDMQDIITRSITIPSSGYIVVHGNCVLQVYGTTGRCQAHVQIDETAGGSHLQPYYRTAGLGASASSTTYSYFPTSAVRVYSKSAGTYTFRLEARAHPSNAAGALPKIMYGWIIATFYPTAYGSVSTLVSAGETGDFDQAEAVDVMAAEPGEVGTPQTLFRVDLRDLELKAARAEAAAERALRELAEARAVEAVQSDAIAIGEER